MTLNSEFEDGLRGVALGVFLLVAIVAVAVCCFTGAFVIGRWIWSVV